MAHIDFDLHRKVMLEGEGDKINKKNDEVIFSYGRFQPPTLGHGLLVDKIQEKISNKGNKADGYIFISSSQNEPLEKMKNKKLVKEIQKIPELFEEYVNKPVLRNPLTVYQKTYFMKKMFPESQVKIVNTSVCKIKQSIDKEHTPCKSIFDIIYNLVEAGYKKLTLIVGSDRYEDFKKIIEKINERRVIEELEPIKIEKVGSTRNSKYEDLSGMSGSKMRIYAFLNDYYNFSNGIQTYNSKGEANLTEEEIYYLMHEIVRGIGLKTRYVGIPESPALTPERSEYYDMDSPESPKSPPRIERKIMIPRSTAITYRRPFEELSIEPTKSKVGTKRRTRGGKRNLRKLRKNKTKKIVKKNKTKKNKK